MIYRFRVRVQSVPSLGILSREFDVINLARLTRFGACSRGRDRRYPGASVLVPVRTPELKLCGCECPHFDARLREIVHRIVRLQHGVVQHCHAPVVQKKPAVAHCRAHVVPHVPPHAGSKVLLAHLNLGKLARADPETRVGHDTHGIVREYI